MLATEDDMVRTVTKKAKAALVDAAQGVRTIAGEALGAATKAAADVVFESSANALAAGRARLQRATPRMENALGNAARRTITKRRTSAGRKRSAKTATARKRGAKRKANGRKKAVKARRTAKRRRAR